MQGYARATPAERDELGHLALPALCARPPQGVHRRRGSVARWLKLDAAKTNA